MPTILLIEKLKLPDGLVQPIYCVDGEEGNNYMALPCGDSDLAVQKAIKDHIALRKAAGVDHAGAKKRGHKTFTVT